jgi:hypothetical protein
MDVIYNKKMYRNSVLESKEPSITTEKGSGKLLFYKVLVIKLSKKEYEKIFTEDEISFYTVHDTNTIFRHNSIIKNMVIKPPYVFLDILIFNIEQMNKDDIRRLKIDLML